MSNLFHTTTRTLYHARCTAWLSSTKKLLIGAGFLDAVRVGPRVLWFCVGKDTEQVLEPAGGQQRFTEIALMPSDLQHFPALRVPAEHEGVLDLFIKLDVARAFAEGSAPPFDFYSDLCWLFDVRAQLTLESFARWLTAVVRLKR